MLSKRSSSDKFFSKTLFLKDITSFFPAWTLYALFLVLTVNSSSTPRKVDGRIWGVYDFATTASSFMTFACFIMAVLSAMLVFRYLFGVRQCYTMHSLPVSRTAMFNSHLLAGYVFGLAPAAVSAIIAFTAGSAQTLLWFFSVALQYTFFYGVAVLSMMLSGALISYITFVLIFNFGALFAIVLINNTFGQLIESIVTDDNAAIDFAKNITPTLMIPNLGHEYIYDTAYNTIGVSYTHLPYATAAAVVGLAAIIGAFLLYRARRSERAGYPLAFAETDIICHIIATFYGTLTLGYIIANIAFSQNAGGFMFSFVIAAFISFFGARMIINRTTRVFTGKRFLIFFIICVLLIFSVLACENDIFGIGSYIPDPENVSSAYIISQYRSYGEDNMYVSDPERIKLITELHRELQENGDSNEFNDGKYQTRIRISYRLKNGLEITREHRLYYSEESLEKEGNTSLYHRISFFYSSYSDLARAVTGKEDALTEEIITNIRSLETNWYGKYDSPIKEILRNESLDEEAVEKYYEYFTVNNSAQIERLIRAVILDVQNGKIGVMGPDPISTPNEIFDLYLFVIESPNGSIAHNIQLSVPFDSQTFLTLIEMIKSEGIN